MLSDSAWNSYEYPGRLHNSAHQLIDDIIAVFGNLGFRVKDTPSRSRQWTGGQWQDFHGEDGTLLFQVKGYLNGNIHLRFAPKTIRALNIEAGRILGWVRSREEVVDEMGYSAEDAQRYFQSNIRLGVSAVKLLGAGDNHGF